MKTPLYEAHLALGARMVDFAGWQMPVQYGGILQEHRHTRAGVSLFDTCHMSQFRVGGAQAQADLCRAIACRVERLRVGQCRYGFLLAGSGGIIDDVICYRAGQDDYMLVTNAGTRQRDAEVLGERLGDAVEDVSAQTGKLDLQGPGSSEVLCRLSGGACEGVRYYHFARMAVAGVEALVSRTGYTGEVGYELYVPADRVLGLWQSLLCEPEVAPAGLGARDTLRLEMGYPLYGHELSEDVTPLEAGLEWALPEEGRYVGAEAIRRLRKERPQRRLVGVEFCGRRAGRAGDPLVADGADVGRLTSGSFAPSLGHAVGLGYVPVERCRPGTPLAAGVRGRRVAGRVVELPFYRRGLARTGMVREGVDK